MHIPHERLAPDVLRAVIEEYITREGTFVGDGDAPDLDADVAKVLRQLDAGDVVITFDEDTGTTSIVRPSE